MSPLPLMLPLSISSSYAAAPANNVAHEDTSCTATRTLWSIIISCVTTIFACTWTVIHPNVPGLTEGPVTVGIRHLKIMVLAFFFPEFVLQWAAHQLIDAIRVQRLFQGALLDGALQIHMKPNCEPCLVHSGDPCSSEADRLQIKIPKRAIGSWSDICGSLSSWIRARVHGTPSPDCEGSPNSSNSLEGYTYWTLKHSFYASMGGFILVINNKDPPVHRRVYYPLTPDELFKFLEQDLVQVPMVDVDDLGDRSKGDCLSKTVAILQLVWFVMQLAARYFRRLHITPLEADAFAVSVLGIFTYTLWWHKPKGVNRPVFVYWKGPEDPPKTRYCTPQSIMELAKTFKAEESWIVSFGQHIFSPLCNFVGIGCVTDADIHAHRVPPLCGYAQMSDPESIRERLSAFIGGNVAGVVFGSIHCVAWRFPFPTYIDKLLWCIASVALVAAPFLELANFFICLYGKRVRWHVASFGYFFAVLAILYCTGRAIIVVIMFLSLRSSTPGILAGVCWLSFIPHY